MNIHVRGAGPRRRHIATGVAIVLLLALCPMLARAEEPSDFSLGIGYAHLRIGGTESVLHSEDALRFDPVISFSPIESLPQLRLGGAVGFAMVFDDSQRAIISNDNGLVVVGRSNVPLILIEPEARVSWRQYFDRGHTFFIQPGIGAGGTVGYLSVAAEDSGSGPSISEWDSTWSARAFVDIGFRVEGGIVGFQMSYMRGGDLDFARNARGEITEYYIGIFGALQF